MWTFYHENRLWTNSGVSYGDNPDREFEALSFLWNQAAFKALDILPEEALVRVADFLGYFVTKPIVVGYRVKIPASIYLDVWSSKAVAMDLFYASLREAGTDLGIRLPPDMLYRGGDPNRI